MVKADGIEDFSVNFKPTLGVIFSSLRKEKVI
jgi:hypothetical protein